MSSFLYWSMFLNLACILLGAGLLGGSGVDVNKVTVFGVVSLVSMLWALANVIGVVVVAL